MASFGGINNFGLVISSFFIALEACGGTSYNGRTLNPLSFLVTGIGLSDQRLWEIQLLLL